MNDNTWEVAVLKTLVDIGDNAELQDIYDRIKCGTHITITPELAAMHIKYNEPHYHIYVRSFLSKLVKKNQVENIYKGEGIYSISPEGLGRLKELDEIEDV